VSYNLNYYLTYPPWGDILIPMVAHTQNTSVIKRLKRASGHLAKVIEMLENETDCMKITQQLQAVSSAIIGAKKTYIHDHVEHCLASAKGNEVNVKLEEFREITRYL
jgi:uncharacterized protein